MPSTTISDSADGSGPTDDQPRASEHEIQERQDERQRSERVDDAFAPDERFGLDGDSMAAGELDSQRRPRIVASLSLDASLCWAAMLRSRASSARENSASYGGRLGMRDDEPARPVGRDVSAFRSRSGAPSAERFSRQLEQPGGIVAHEIRTRSSEGNVRSSRLLATAALSPVGTKPVERLVQRVVVEQQQLAIRKPAEIARFGPPRPRPRDRFREPRAADRSRRRCDRCSRRSDIPSGAVNTTYS